MKKPEDKAFKYTRFSITAPKNNEVIWNNPQLMVSLKISPALNVKEGHTTWLLMDGKPLVKKSRSLLLQIGRADRGEHKLQALIRDKKGRVIKAHKNHHRAHQKFRGTTLFPLTHIRNQAPRLKTSPKTLATHHNGALE